MTPDVETTGDRIPATRGQDTAGSLFPVIISPRKTQLLTTRPVLRWSAVASPTPGAAVTYRLYPAVELFAGPALAWNPKKAHFHEPMLRLQLAGVVALRF